ncbi:MAG TPA: hypothetical protein VIR78_11900 [Malonomonas sp.]
MNEFSFEETILLSEEEYVDIFGVIPKSRKTFMRFCMLAVGVICLFFPFTQLLGIFLLGMAFVSVVMNRNLPGMSKQTYKAKPYYHQPVTYGITQNKLWANFENFNISSAWENLAVWQLQGKWVRLSPHGLPPIIFKKESLEKAGILETVLQKAKQFGVEFNSPEAKRAF